MNRMTLALKIVRIRLNRGEDLDAILASYPRLSVHEVSEIRRIIESENQ